MVLGRASSILAQPGPLIYATKSLVRVVYEIHINHGKNGHRQLPRAMVKSDREREVYEKFAELNSVRWIYRRKFCLSVFINQWRLFRPLAVRTLQL